VFNGQIELGITRTDDCCLCTHCRNCTQRPSHDILKHSVVFLLSLGPVFTKAWDLGCFPSRSRRRLASPLVRESRARGAECGRSVEGATDEGARGGGGECRHLRVRKRWIEERLSCANRDSLILSSPTCSEPAKGPRFCRRGRY
jgi:hypothetical protein